MQCVDSFDHQIDGWCLLCLPSFGDEKEGLEHSDGALDQLPFRDSEGEGRPGIGLVILKEGLEDTFQEEDGGHIGEGAVPPRGVWIFQLPKLYPKIGALGFQLLICNGGGGVCQLG